jgi:hypothetical protein
MKPSDIRHRRFRLPTAGLGHLPTNTLLMRVLYSCNGVCKCQSTDPSAQGTPTTRDGFEYFANHNLSGESDLKRTDERFEKRVSDDHKRETESGMTGGREDEEDGDENLDRISAIRPRKQKICLAQLCVSSFSLPIPTSDVKG